MKNLSPFYQLFLFLLTVFICAPLRAASHPAYNTFAVDLPFSGGAMATYSRFYKLTRFIDAGVVLSGGKIDRDIDLKDSSGATINTQTEAWVLPLAGPVVSLHNDWIGISLGYAAFHANTDITMKNDTLGTLTGHQSGWGTGIYSPLLVLDFFDKKHDLVFGFGLGGYFGMSYPTLTASNAIVRVTTNENPIDTLTFHTRILWGDRQPGEREKSVKDEDF